MMLPVLQLVLMPFVNVVSRRYEAEADWSALRATHDPSAAESLFRKFTRYDLAQPELAGRPAEQTGQLAGILATYGDNFDRLVQVKQRYDEHGDRMTFGQYRDEASDGTSFAQLVSLPRARTSLAQ